MDYWEELISEAFEDAKLEATKEQIDTVASWVEGGTNNYGTAHGYDAIDNYSEADIELAKYKAEEKKQRDWENSTVPCKECTTTGLVIDTYGREIGCLSCEGAGRIASRWAR